MGLLSDAGRDLKGLFADPDRGDAFAQAQAFLDGDYGTGIGLAARRFRRRRRGSTSDATEDRGAEFEAGSDEATVAAAPSIGTVTDAFGYGGNLGQAMQRPGLGNVGLAAGAPMPSVFARWY